MCFFSRLIQEYEMDKAGEMRPEDKVEMTRLSPPQ
jgi:hypothetical protein